MLAERSEVRRVGKKIVEGLSGLDYLREIESMVQEIMHGLDVEAFLDFGEGGVEEMDYRDEKHQQTHLFRFSDENCGI